jgi:hypothetical protein
MTRPDIWYVSYRPNAAPGCKRRRVRITRKFKTEIDAKQFAQEIIKTAGSVIAGTLNPYTPRKAVASKSILDWISGKD